jgi:hypothetical protein
MTLLVVSIFLISIFIYYLSSYEGDKKKRLDLKYEIVSVLLTTGSRTRSSLEETLNAERVSPVKSDLVSRALYEMVAEGTVTLRAAEEVEVILSPAVGDVSGRAAAPAAAPTPAPAPEMEG